MSVKLSPKNHASPDRIPMHSNATLLSIDMTTCRVTRYIGKQQTHNIRFDRLLTESEIDRMRRNPHTFLMEETDGDAA